MSDIFIVEGPNGLRVQFPAGTNDEIVNRVMAQAYQEIFQKPSQVPDNLMKPWDVPDRAPTAAQYPWDVPDAPPDISSMKFRISDRQQSAAVPQRFRLLQQPQPSNGGFEEFKAMYDRGEIMPVNDGSMLADVGNQFRKGLVQGTGGLIAMPASIGRWLGDRAGDGLDWMTGTDTSADRARVAEQYRTPFDPVAAGQAISNSTGIGEAQTTAGEFSNTIGQFLPGLLMGRPTPAAAANIGGTMRLMATAATTGAIGSEAAGQMTEGTAAEPYARLGGALAGALAPGGLARVVSPNSIPAERRALIDALTREGVPLTAGQKTGSKALKYLESELGGGKTANAMEKQAEAFTRAAAGKAGIRADRLTPEVMDDAFTSIGRQFDDLVAKTDIKLDAKLQNDLLDAVSEYQSVAGTPAGAPEQIMNRIADMASKNGGVVKGEAYRNVSSDISRYLRSSGADPALKEALRNMKDSLDDAVERSLSGDLLKQWRQARNQYRNLLTIEDAVSKGGERAAEGLLTPSQFRQSVVSKQGRRNYVRGEGDYAELSRAGEAVMKALPDSGTASRSAARNLTLGIPGAIGAGIGSPGGPMGAILGALTGAAVPFAAGRALMSKPVQSYLVNQLLRRGRKGSKAGRAVVGGAGAGAGISNPRD